MCVEYCDRETEEATVYSYLLVVNLNISKYQAGIYMEKIEQRSYRLNLVVKM